MCFFPTYDVPGTGYAFVYRFIYSFVPSSFIYSLCAYSLQSDWTYFWDVRRATNLVLIWRLRMIEGEWTLIVQFVFCFVVLYSSLFRILFGGERSLFSMFIAFMRPFVRSFMNPFAYSFISSFIFSCIHICVHWLVHSFIRSFPFVHSIHSFIQKRRHLWPRFVQKAVEGQTSYYTVYSWLVKWGSKTDDMCN